MNTIVLMKRFLPLLMLTGLLFGQDVLNLKSGESYTGTFYGKVGEDIVFKVEGETSIKKFSINDVEIIKIKSGELSYPFDVPKIANDAKKNNGNKLNNYIVCTMVVILLIIFIPTFSSGLDFGGGGGGYVPGDTVPVPPTL